MLSLIWMRRIASPDLAVFPLSMLPHHAPAPQPPHRFGVVIDTYRYGHSAVYL
jgi:hypothetical protein